jgi:hypothetical protein
MRAELAGGQVVVASSLAAFDCSPTFWGMNARTIVFAVACALPLVANAEWDQLEYPAQSLFVTDVPQVQEPGAFQSTNNGRWSRSDDGTRNLDIPLEAEVGVLPRTQLRAEVPFTSEMSSAETTRGLSNIELGTRYGFTSSKTYGFAVSGDFDVLLPPPTDGISEDRYGVRPRIMAFQQAGPVGVTASFAPVFARTEQEGWEPKIEVGAGATLFRGPIVPAFDVKVQPWDEERIDATAGFRVKPAKVLELGLGVLAGNRDGQGTYGAASSLILNLGN